MKNFWIVILIIVVAALTGTHFWGNQQSAVMKESVYDRIHRTGEIRCGYSSWKPVFFIDPKTGEKKGIFHDIMEEIGRRLEVKIVWQEEIGWGSIVEAVSSGRVDMACSGYWLNAGRIKNMSSSFAQLYTPLGIYVRRDQKVDAKNLDELNNAAFTVATIDGSAESQVIAKRFTKTRKLTLTELNTDADEIEALLTKKADFIILDSASAATYEAANPGKIQNVFGNKPVVVFPNVIFMAAQEIQLKEMIDNMLRSIEYDGTLDAILKSYSAQSAFWRNPKLVEAVSLK